MPKMAKHSETPLLGPGGKGSNQAVAAGKLGADVTIISRLGEDDFGQMACDLEGAHVKGAIKYSLDVYTSAAFIFIDDKTGDNAIYCTGAAADISVEDIRENADLIAAADTYAAEQPIDVAHEGLITAKRNGKITTKSGTRSGAS